MKDFSVQDCPKCRTYRSGVRIRWCDKNHDDTLPPGARSEHMHHACTTCGYAWVTRTADCPDPDPTLVSLRNRP